MADFKIRTYNKIAKIGIDKFSSKYDVGENITNADAIILRSYDMHSEPVDATVAAIGRAGAGVNNIPVDDMTNRGVVVFNAPGANANSVKELVIGGLLIASRNLDGALEYTKSLNGDIKTEVEAGKKKYAGSELKGKKLGVIGLGAIGYRVANAAKDLGMDVYGFDPALSTTNAWQINPEILQVENIEKIYDECDFISLHVPLLPATEKMVSSESINLMKPTAVLLNFSRDKIVDEQAVIKALENSKIAKYITDFPNEITLNKPGVVALPHLGASTEEAEDNCAVMVADQLIDFLENGNIINSVNFPEARLAKKGKARLCITHENKTGVVAEISKVVSDAKLNIVELLNKSRNDVAYSILDLDTVPNPEVINKLSDLGPVKKIRLI